MKYLTGATALNLPIDPCLAGTPAAWPISQRGYGLTRRASLIERRAILALRILSKEKRKTRHTLLKALGDNLCFEFPGKSAAMLVGLGYA